MLQCFVCSPIPKVSEKKGATGQSFIRKEITSYRIGTLIIGSILNFLRAKKSDIEVCLQWSTYSKVPIKRTGTYASLAVNIYLSGDLTLIRVSSGFHLLKL